MTKDIQLFACLCIGKGVLDVKACQRLSKILPDDVELLDFAQAILDHDLYDNFDAMQELLDQAVEMEEQGDEPPFNPFAELKRKPGATRPSVVLGTTPAHPEPEPVPEPEPEPAEEASRPKISLRKAPITSDDESPAQATKAEPEPETAGPSDDLAAAVSAIWQATGTKAPQGAVAGVDMEKVEAAANFDTQAAQKAIDAYGEQSVQVEEMRKMVEEIVSKMAPGEDGQPEHTAKPRESVVKTQGVKPVWPDPARLDPGNRAQLRAAILGLLINAAERGASDVHVSADSRLFIRRNREVEYVSKTVVPAEVAKGMNLSVLSQEQQAYFDAEQDYDFAMPLDQGQRFRVNLMRHKDGVAGTYRIVPSKIPSLEQLGFDPKGAETIKQLLAYHNGLILVTGPVGAGKTSTLAALVDILNQSREDHVITVEEPIEVIQQSSQCQITQRGVGPHTRTFKSALKGALRQDPDIIVIGEMRDLETIEMAISASETGHLVIGTMHTSDAATTLNRLLDVFPPAQQPQIRAMVAESLRGILCQRLLPAKGDSIALAYELLLKNTAVSALIRDGKSEGLGNIIETGRRDGMKLMDTSVMELWEAGRINDETALGNLRSDPLKNQIRGVPATRLDAPAPEPTSASKKKGFFGR